MKQTGLALLLLSVFGLPALAPLGCQTQKATRPAVEPPPPGFQPVTIDFADTDAFDALLESALTNQDPVILVQTANERPDWGPRLNAWIAAWNQGGTVGPPGGRKARMQAPLPRVVVDGDSIRELRLLIDDLMGRAEEAAARGSAWYREGRTRAHRVGLLKPYNLRFHQDGSGHIQIIFFNGRYSEYHRNFVQSIADPDPENGEEWTRSVCCSRCRERPSEDPPGGKAEAAAREDGETAPQRP
jgi:hypothetical protein